MQRSWSNRPTEWSMRGEESRNTVQLKINLKLVVQDLPYFPLVCLKYCNISFWAILSTVKCMWSPKVLSQNYVGNVITQKLKALILATFFYIANVHAKIKDNQSISSREFVD